MKQLKTRGTLGITLQLQRDLFQNIIIDLELLIINLQNKKSDLIKLMQILYFYNVISVKFITRLKNFLMFMLKFQYHF